MFFTYDEVEGIIQHGAQIFESKEKPSNKWVKGKFEDFWFKSTDDIQIENGQTVIDNVVCNVSIIDNVKYITPSFDIYIPA